MAGLLLKLAPGERFIVNGAVLENGDKYAKIRVTDGNARVLRCSDAIRPEDVDTPVKQIYFAVQLLITGDLDEDATLPAIAAACHDLADAFASVDRTFFPVLRAMLDRRNYYSALCHMKPILELEAQLLARGSETDAAPPDLKVA